MDGWLSELNVSDEVKAEFGADPNINKYKTFDEYVKGQQPTGGQAWALDCYPNG